HRAAVPPPRCPPARCVLFPASERPLAGLTPSRQSGADVAHLRAFAFGAGARRNRAAFSRARRHRASRRDGAALLRTALHMRRRPPPGLARGRHAPERTADLSTSPHARNDRPPPWPPPCVRGAPARRRCPVLAGGPGH